MKKVSKANILVTGGTGYIGSHLIYALLTQNHKITLLVRNKTKAVLLFGNKVTYHQTDLSKPNAFDSLGTNFDFIFHLGAAVSYRLPSKEMYYTVNEGGTQQLVDFANKQKNLQKLVYVSSVGVYGPIKLPPANENTLHKPENDYEKSKNNAEKIVTNSQLPYVVLQPTLVYGPDDTASGMFRLFMAAMSGKFISIGFTPVMMHPVHIDNIVQALLKAAFGSVQKETFIIGDAKPIALRRLAAQIADGNNTKLLPIKIPTFIAFFLGIAGDILLQLGLPAPLSSGTVHFMTHHRAFSINKAIQQLGYKPSKTTKQGVTETVDWYQKNS